MIEKPDCEECRAIKAEAGEEPTCWSCIPEIDPQNESVIEVWNMVMDQVRPNGAIDMNVIFLIMDELETPDRLETVARIKHLFGKVKEHIESTKGDN